MVKISRRRGVSTNLELANPTFILLLKTNLNESTLNYAIIMSK